MMCLFNNPFKIYYLSIILLSLFDKADERGMSLLTGSHFLPRKCQFMEDLEVMETISGSFLVSGIIMNYSKPYQN